MTKTAAKKFIKTFFKFTILFGIIAVIASVAWLYYVATNLEAIDYDSIGLNFSSIIYYTDGDGNHHEYEQIYGDQNRLWADLSEMPTYLPKAFVAIEDERFYSHSGFDIPRTVKATFNYIFNKDSSFGGSTINQQLVKNITGEDDTTPQRKIMEIFRAIDMDKKLSKDQILELYLNTIYLSQGCNGVETAANKYFGKTVSQLTLAECASIAGITQFPTKYDPLLNPENNKEKKDIVLGKMLELQMISQEEYDQAIQEELKFQNNDLSETGNAQSYFIDQLIEDVVPDLQKELSVSRSIALKMLYSGGLQIYATVDPEIQKSVDEVFTNPEDYIPYRGETPPQAGIVVMDPYTGAVKGMAGGLGTKQGSRTLNRATQTKRQPGSTIKPLSVYAPGFEYNKFTPNTVFVDEPYKVGEFSFKNQYNGFRGPMTVRTAIEVSCNTVAVKALQMVGIETSYDFMVNKLNFSSIVPEDKGLSPLGLGGLTNGVSVLEMTAAYSSFVNSGIYTQPYTYTKITDRNGKTILEKKKESSVAMKESTAYTTLQMLQSVVANGTGVQATLPNGIPTGGKTGTTDDDKDRWYVGVSPYYVAGVWFGYDTPKQITGYSTNPALALWKGVMAKVHSDLPSKPFQKPNGLVSVDVCMDSGQLAGELCSQDYRGSRVVTELMSKSTAPTQTCSLHQYVKVDTSTNQIAGPNCPLNLVEIRIMPQAQDGSICQLHNPSQ